MNFSPDEIKRDLAPFADLGTAAPEVSMLGQKRIARLIRDGQRHVVTVFDDGRVSDDAEGSVRHYISLRSLLASPDYANLRKRADNQKVLLRSRVSTEGLPLIGKLGSSQQTGRVELLASALDLSPNNVEARSTIMLLDGPAGIGKTSAIRALSFARAESFLVEQKALVLHVESRGRMLQNITDLMAFSLQSLRLTVTYDQIPALVRHGLILLAIDGFDELADPSGYELAWAQVNELVQECKGIGAIMLAGRETFIRKARLIGALPGLDPDKDTVDVFTLQPLSPSVARDWLKQSGWPENILTSEQAEPIFEKRSYALTPFFLSQLASPAVAAQLESGELDDLLPFLIRATASREAEKFGAEIDRVCSKAQLISFIVKLMEETARDLAENQADAISVDALAWLAEVAASDLIPQAALQIVRNRAEVLAFFTNDERPYFRRFAHETLLNYFLAYATIVSITSGEVPKFIKRNIFGFDFLLQFTEVIRKAPEAKAKMLISEGVKRLNTLTDQDRARRNIAALLIATYSVTELTEKPVISNVSVDEAYFAETAFFMELKNVTIGRLDARECDLRAVKFTGDCYIGSMIADDSTVPAYPMPIPSLIDLPDCVLSSQPDKTAWVTRQHARSLKVTGSIWDHANKPELLGLLHRLARYKPFWLKNGEEKAARKILDDPYWETLKDILIENDMLIERRDLAASGRNATFWHLRNRQDFLKATLPDHLKKLVLELLQVASARIYAALPTEHDDTD